MALLWRGAAAKCLRALSEGGLALQSPAPLSEIFAGTAQPLTGSCQRAARSDNAAPPGILLKEPRASLSTTRSSKRGGSRPWKGLCGQPQPSHSTKAALHGKHLNKEPRVPREARWQQPPAQRCPSPAPRDLHESSQWGALLIHAVLTLLNYKVCQTRA